MICQFQYCKCSLIVADWELQKALRRAFKEPFAVRTGGHVLTSRPSALSLGDQPYSSLRKHFVIMSTLVVFRVPDFSDIAIFFSSDPRRSLRLSPSSIWRPTISIRI